MLDEVSVHANLTVTRSLGVRIVGEMLPQHRSASDSAAFVRAKLFAVTRCQRF